MEHCEGHVRGTQHNAGISHKERKYTPTRERSSKHCTRQQSLKFPFRLGSEINAISSCNDCDELSCCRFLPLIFRNEDWKFIVQTAKSDANVHIVSSKTAKLCIGRHRLWCLMRWVENLFCGAVDIGHMPCWMSVKYVWCRLWCFHFLFGSPLHPCIAHHIHAQTILCHFYKIFFWLYFVDSFPWHALCNPSYNACQRQLFCELMFLFESKRAFLLCKLTAPTTNVRVTACRFSLFAHNK